MGLAQVPGHRGAVALADHEMNVQRRTAGRRLGHVADQRGDLDLLAQCDPTWYVGFSDTTTTMLPLTRQVRVRCF